MEISGYKMITLRKYSAKSYTEQKILLIWQSTSFSIFKELLRINKKGEEINNHPTNQTNLQPNNKMDKRYKHAFAKENIKMTKLYKMILKSGKWKLNTLSYHKTMTTMVYIKKMDNINCWQKCAAISPLTYSWWKHKLENYLAK